MKVMLASWMTVWATAKGTLINRIKPSVNAKLGHYTFSVMPKEPANVLRLCCTLHWQSSCKFCIPACLAGLSTVRPVAQRS